jgi:hypothetical protein
VRREAVGTIGLLGTLFVATDRLSTTRDASDAVAMRDPIAFSHRVRPTFGEVADSKHHYSPAKDGQSSPMRGPAQTDLSLSQAPHHRGHGSDSGQQSQVIERIANSPPPKLPNGWPMCRRSGRVGLVAGEAGAVGTIGLLGRLNRSSITVSV